MSVRDTSREAYDSIVPDLNEKQAIVLAAIEMHQPLTNSELSEVLGWSINRITPRVLELRNLGKVVDLGKRSCRVTGRNAHEWGVGKETLF